MQVALARCLRLSLVGRRLLRAKHARHITGREMAVCVRVCVHVLSAGRRWCEEGSVSKVLLDHAIY